MTVDVYVPRTSGWNFLWGSRGAAQDMLWICYIGGYTNPRIRWNLAELGGGDGIGTFMIDKKIVR